MQCSGKLYTWYILGFILNLQEVRPCGYQNGMIVSERAVALGCGHVPDVSFARPPESGPLWVQVGNPSVIMPVGARKTSGGRKDLRRHNSDIGEVEISKSFCSPSR